MAQETVRLQLMGKDFACTVCGFKDFFRKKVVLKEPTGGMFNTGSNEEAISLICTQCGYIHSFLPRFTRIEPVKDE